MNWVTRAFLLGVFAATVQAQSKDPHLPKNQATSTNPLGLWDADAMMEQATINIARRYNLDKEQEQYTRQLLRKRTKEFLTVYEDEVRNLLKDLFMQQLSGQMPTPEQARDWGARARPVLEASKRAILDGNMEWRDILREDQKKIHDIDLKLMDNNFRMLEQRFARWNEGNFKPGDWLGAPQTRRNQPRSKPKVETSSHPPSNVRNTEDYWDIFVKKFIRDYNLDEAQRNSALAVLKDMREKAARMRKKTDARRKAAQEKLHHLIKEKAPPEQIKEASRRLREAEQPMSVLFEELRTRLAKIPTEAQRRKVERDYMSTPVPSGPKAQEKQNDSTSAAKQPGKDTLKKEPSESDKSDKPAAQKPEE